MTVGWTHQKDAGRALREVNAWLIWITADQQQNGVTRPEKEGVLFMSGYKRSPLRNHGSRLLDPRRQIQVLQGTARLIREPLHTEGT